MTMRPVWYRLLVVYAAVSILLSLSNTVRAIPPDSLATALSRTTDGARRRVPLLVIGAESTRLDTHSDSGRKVYELYRGDDAAMPLLTDILAGFGRQLISCSSVQVVAPLTRLTFNPNPGPPEEWARMGRDQAARLLFASLTSTQWQAASSANGLGIADLAKPTQKTWFLSLISEPFVLREIHVGNNGSITSPGTQTIAPKQVRLRVVRKMDWQYKTSTNDSFGYDHSHYTPHKPGETYWEQVAEQRTMVMETYRDKLADVVWVREPNKLKAGDLDFNTTPLYGVKVSLTDIKTVGELVNRVAQKTGIELYADRRLSGLSVRAVGAADSTPDAADLMKALCYATTGTIRKVSDGKSTVYLLTSDHNGYAAPRLRLAEWAADVETLAQQGQEGFGTVARNGDFVKGIGFAEGTPQLSPTIMAQVEAALESPDRNANNYYGLPRVMVSDLDDRLQKTVQGEVTGYKDFTVPGEIIKTAVYPFIRIEAKLFVPGYGTFDGIHIAYLQEMLHLQPLREPATDANVPKGSIAPPAAFAKFAALKIAPKNDAEIDTAVAWAKKHGFTALLIRTSLWNTADQALLAHAVTVGAANNLPVYPAVSLLKAPLSDSAKTGTPSGDLPRVHNILGETLREYSDRRQKAIAAARPEYADLLAQLALENNEDWLDAETKSTRAIVGKRVEAIAQTPGIAGIVLADTAAPGFALMSDTRMTDPMAAAQYGSYSDSLRVALIRRENIDPLDIPVGDNLIPLVYPDSEEDFAPYSTDKRNLWELFQKSPAFRRDTTTEGWTSTPLDTSADDFAGWNALRRSTSRTWMGRLREGGSVPTGFPLYWETGDGAPRMSSDPALLRIALTMKSTPQSVRDALGPQLAVRVKNNKESPYAGIVLDTTMLDWEKALTVLDSLQGAK